MTKTDNNALFVSALKEAVRQYPSYFYTTAELDDIDSMWDMQPQFNKLESLLLEDEPTQQFIMAVWSFFKPLGLSQVGIAESTRAMYHWQKMIISQMILHDPMGNKGEETGS